MQAAKFTDAHIKDWHEQGFAIIEDFFSPDEIAGVRSEYERIYGTDRAGEALNLKEADSFGEFRPDQFKNLDTFPYEGGAPLNLLSLNPDLIEFARALLGVPKVHLYQSHTWAKYTGEADYDQTFHCDYGNHTLLVPSEQPALRAVNFIIYITDVTDAHGALHYVTKPDADELLRPGAVNARDENQRTLLERQRSAAAPAGTLVAHSIDTFHRGTNLTEPGGHRFTMTVSFKASGNEMVGYHVWQTGENRPWHLVFEHANPEQLACLGIPAPGDAYWNERTLKLSQARWPMWDMSEYFAAAGLKKSA
jgi:ectoine hydroxylase-related dioxygenase (phytanoyl-CoA dioxygenase family)